MRTRSRYVLVVAFILFAFASVMLAACARPGSAPAASAQGQGNSTPTQASSNGGGTNATPTQASNNGGGVNGSATVHMNETNFVENSVTVNKGSSLTLVDDAAVVHIITNGTWDNGTPKPIKEAGAPTVNQMFQGNDTKTIGPFNTAGTFHLYCTVHVGMNLTVTVK